MSMIDELPIERLVVCCPFTIELGCVLMSLGHQHHPPKATPKLVFKTN
jgi:hypothetical protein